MAKEEKNSEEHCSKGKSLQHKTLAGQPTESPVMQ